MPKPNVLPEAQTCAACKWWTAFDDAATYGTCEWPCPAVVMLPSSILQSDYVSERLDNISERMCMYANETNCPVWERTTESSSALWRAGSLWTSRYSRFGCEMRAG